MMDMGGGSRERTAWVVGGIVVMVAVFVAIAWAVGGCWR
jgi:hypothetical protein